MTDLSGHNPVCDHRYPTRTCGRSNPAVRSSWDNVTSPRSGWSDHPARETRRLPAPRRSGARVDGMANSGELLINVVRSNKPKALRGLNQKVRGQVQRDLPSPVVVVASHRRRGRAYTIRDSLLCKKIKFPRCSIRPGQRKLGLDEACVEVAPRRGGTPRATVPDPGTPGLRSSTFFR